MPLWKQGEEGNYILSNSSIFRHSQVIPTRTVTHPRYGDLSFLRGEWSDFILSGIWWNRKRGKVLKLPELPFDADQQQINGIIYVPLEKCSCLIKKNMVANSVLFGCVIDLVLFAVQRETKFICCNRVEIHRFKPWRGNVVCPPMQHKSERYVANPSCTIHWGHYWNFRAMNFPFLYCFCFLSWDQQARLKIYLSRP